MKSYTDLKQSKKLAKILPLESADMCWFEGEPFVEAVTGYEEERAESHRQAGMEMYPCWSLAALISILPKEIEIDGQHYAPCLFPVQDKWLLKLWYNSNYTITSSIAIFSDNPVDACYEMIIRLNELKLL